MYHAAYATARKHMKHLVIGITAHVDAGKTTLAEALLYRTGEIRHLGRVDHGDAFLDTHPMEQARGITIFAHQAQFCYQDALYTLLDTPGHVDFSAETERTLQVLDYAILVISGTDGIQSHTETLWQLLKRLQIPVFLFVNKMDLPTADKSTVLAELQQRFGEAVTDFSNDHTTEFLERLALHDERWMEQYLTDETIPLSEIQQQILTRKVIPCYFGAALKLTGVDAFLKGLHRYTIEKSYSTAFGARCFKITSDEKNNRLTWCKITGGQLHVRDTLSYPDATGEIHTEKATQIRIYDGIRFTSVETASAGTICAVTGLSHTFSGQGLGEAENAIPPILEPVLRYGVLLPASVPPHDAWKQLCQLEEEDPALHLVWDAQHSQIQIQLMGEVQLEVLRQLIAERFGLDVQFDAGQIRYKETIAALVEGIGHYEPLRHYAEVHLLLEPLPQGSGLQFTSSCREDGLDKNWQRLILTHLAEKTHLGVLTGSPITDLKITLCAGRAHIKHTEGGDFRQATYRAVRNGLRKAQSILLEPWYAFVLEVPTTCVGRAMTDLQQMHAQYTSTPTQDGKTILTGSAPVKQLSGYQQILTSYTHGTGRLSCTPKGYAPCQDAQQVIETIGYDCDSDLENTADSIFCAHGSGFSVPWYQVETYAHIPLQTLQKQNATEESTSQNSAPIPEKAVSRYLDSLAADKELMEIFERTYGKISRDPRHALHTPKEKTPQVSTTDNISPSNAALPEYLLVDGYNIIFAWDTLKALAEDNLDAAREQLIQMLCNYAGVRQGNLILVFDAYRVKGQKREIISYCNINIVYTKEAETADTYIEKISHDLSKKYRVRVATSDGMEQVIILGNGALRVSADEFYQEVQNTQRAIHEYMEKQKLGKKTILEKHS